MYKLEVKSYEECKINKNFKDEKELLSYLTKELDREMIESIELKFKEKIVCGYYQICEEILLKI